MSTEQPQKDTEKAHRVVTPPPSEEPQRKYITFYKVLLVLSTLGTLVSLTGISGLRGILEIAETEPAYAWISIAGLLVSLPLALAALLLLFHKHPAGIKIKLASYAVIIVTTLLSVPFAGGALERAEEETLRQLEEQNLPLDPELISLTTTVVFYGAVAGTVIFSVLFATLWWNAWKKQVAYDTEYDKKGQTSH